MPVHWDQLRAQRSETSMEELYLVIRSIIHHEECPSGGYLPYLGLEPIGGQTT